MNPYAGLLKYIHISMENYYIVIIVFYGRTIEYYFSAFTPLQKVYNYDIL